MFLKALTSFRKACGALTLLRSIKKTQNKEIIHINKWIMKKITFLILFLLPLFCFSQDTLVKWNFPNNPDDSIADGGISANLGMMISTKGGTSSMVYNVSGATSNSVSATKWNTGNGTKYWQIKFVSLGYQTLTLSSKQRSSNTGPRDFKVQYQIGYTGTWADVPGAVVLDSNNWSYGVLSHIALPLACDNQDTVYLRWIMTSETSANGGAVASAGTSRLDDIIILGDVLTGIEVYAVQHDVKIIQNPETITLSLKEPAKEIMIYDILGNLVYKNIKPVSTNTINTGKFNNGIYIVKILFNDNSVTTKKISLI
jgi:hypothetical protein